MLRYSSALGLSLLTAVSMLAGCDSATAPPVGTPEGKPVKISANQSAPIAHSTGAVPARTQQSILIASFNIQAFGQSKMNDRWVMEHLAEVIRQFDVVAIQEIRSKDQRLMALLTEYVNAAGFKYDYILGPRLGRTTSQEQYAYIYDTTRIVSSSDASYTVRDGAPSGKNTQEVGEPGGVDLLHREPLVARFVVNTMPAPFTFSLINIHTDPDEVSYELNVLDDVYISVRNYEYAQANEDDVILLGDLNASPKQFGELGTIPGLRAVISTQATNVRETATYDNILMDEALTSEFKGRGGVLSLKDFFHLTMSDAERLSDHNPIWAEFGINESQSGGRAMASQPGTIRR